MLFNIVDNPENVGIPQHKTQKGKNYFGGKGWNLMVMARTMNLPVPPAFIVPCAASSHLAQFPSEEAFITKQYLGENALLAAISRLEAECSRKFGDTKGMPLLLSVRSGAPVSMPGMMDTILNVGLNDETVEALAKATNDDFAWDSYRRLVLMFASTVYDVDVTELEEAATAVREFSKNPEGMLTAEQSKELIAKARKTLGEKFVPQDLTKQLIEAGKAVWRSWNSDRAKTYREAESISHTIGTAIIYQVMVFGNLDDKSGTGVAFTRNPNTGAAERYGDFLVRAQGEDVVAGTHQTMPLATLDSTWPEIGKELEKHMKTIEKHFKGDLCDIEFTVESGKLYMLQTRIGKRALDADVRIFLDRAAEGHITTDEAHKRLMEILSEARAAGGGTVDASSLIPVGSGLAAVPGVAVGHVYFSADDAERAAEAGQDVIMATIATDPNDVHGMKVSAGILTATGGLVSHAAVVARGWNKPCVVSCENMTLTDGHLKIGDRIINEGDLIKIDGSTGTVFA